MINGDYSRWIQVTSGIPHGSILRPMLFINDMPDNISANLLMFTDDTKIYIITRSSDETEVNPQL